MKNTITLLLALLFAPLAAPHAAAAGSELPRFIVPGHDNFSVKLTV